MGGQGGDPAQSLTGSLCRAAGEAFNGHPQCVPIQPQTVPIDGVKDTRKQLPLRLAWAITIHKSQGMTIKHGQVIHKSVIDLGTKEFQAGLTFVALSRHGDWGDFAFAEFTPDKIRLLRVPLGCNWDARVLEGYRQSLAAASTLAEYQQ